MLSVILKVVKSFFGIDEKKKHQYEVVGVIDADRLVTNILNGINDKDKVSYSTLTEDDIQIITKDQKTLVEVYIEEAPYQKKPVHLNKNINNSYKRANDSNQRLNEEDIRSFYSNSNDSMDDSLLEDFSLEDLVLEDIHHYKKLVSEKTGDDYERYDDIEFLKIIGAYRIKREKGTHKKVFYPTEGCLLFFGKYNSIIEKFPNYQLDYFKIDHLHNRKWSDRVSTGDMNYSNLNNIYSFYNLVLSKLFENVPDRFEQDDLMNRTSFVADMKSAIREAFTNMLMHADYHGKHPLKVTAYDDMFEFYNPGNMRVSKTEFLTGGKTSTRNTIISTLFRKVGLAEKAGYGGYRILHVAQENKLRAPEVIDDMFETTLRIWNVDYLQTLPNISENAKKMYQLIYKNLYATRKEMQAYAKLSEYYTDQSIDELMEMELITREGKGRATKYRLNLSEEMLASQHRKIIKTLDDIFSRETY